ncbi:DNA end-binding protein Ku [Streptomyces sp. TLI_053]|uniref:non-homologous end joining protein Ku n=1 Tax=Streptomyces sp. TLI_053 TaxID=1855352 RepID=UPI00087DB614|nr:Ku protein [Streptomyces sp. TLI_053]SDT81416.1 DNA end-binding protein Ku [Streptomyces sp. TLI_053]
MQTTWKGTISFGLVSIPVHLYSATKEHDVPLHQVHAKDGGRVRMKRYCEQEEKEVPYAEIAKGYESPDGRTVTLTDEDLADLPLPSKKIIDVLAFVDEGEIDPLMFSKAYYVGVADKAASKPYALLRDALVDSGQIAVTKIALRSRESPAVLRVHDGTLVLQTCIWPDEVRPAAGIAPEEDITVRPQELRMARSLMETLSEDFDLEQLHDDYQQALQQVIEARLQGVEMPHEEEAGEAPDNVIDLMEALRSSLRKAKDAHPGRPAAEPEPESESEPEPESEPAEEQSPPRRRAASKRTTAPKAAAATSKKPTTARKSTTAKKSAAAPTSATDKKSTSARKSTTDRSGATDKKSTTARKRTTTATRKPAAPRKAS